MNLDQIGRTMGPFAFKYGWKEVALYNLAIGAGTEELRNVYEGAPGGMKVYPSFGVVALLEPVMTCLGAFGIDFRAILHAEQSLTFHAPIPVRGLFSTTLTVPAVYDKGKAALLRAHSRTQDAEGRLLFEGEAGIFVRGGGGFGGEPGPGAVELPLPGAPPRFEVSQEIGENQAALYRLTGDTNPLHIDPVAAASAGFSRPILHGLCTFGFASRMAVDTICQGDPGRLRKFSARFSNAVYPGQTITTRGWETTPGSWRLGVTTESGAVLSNVLADIE